MRKSKEISNSKFPSHHTPMTHSHFGSLTLSSSTKGRRICRKGQSMSASKLVRKSSKPSPAQKLQKLFLTGKTKSSLSGCPGFAKLAELLFINGQLILKWKWGALKWTSKTCSKQESSACLTKYFHTFTMAKKKSKEPSSSTL